MTTELRSWLASSVVFGLILVGSLWTDLYDGLTRDAFFYAVLVVSYVLVVGVAYRYFCGDKRKRRQENPPRS